jgi:DNA-directed RNA polymerase specialized sigma24 family protein
MNHHRGLWRRLMRELESKRWFDRDNAESPGERAAMNCLARLPQEQREVIVLKFWHRMTFDAMGKLLGQSPNTLAGRYRYGLQKLKACLKGTHDENPESLGSSNAVLEAAPPLGST